MHIQESKGYLSWEGIIVGEKNKITVAPGDRLAEYIEHVSYNLAPVPGGDVLISTANKVIGLERKRGDDAVNSWYSGHLAEQLAIMLGCYDEVVLCVEDSAIDQLYSHFLCFQKPAIMFLNYQQDLITMQEEGVRVVHTTSLQGTASLVQALKRRYDSSIHGALYRQQKPSKEHVYVRMLSVPPGWGIETAKSAVRALETPIAVFNAEPEKLVKVPLVTPRKVKMLFDAIGRRATWTRPNKVLAHLRKTYT